MKAFTLWIQQNEKVKINQKMGNISQVRHLSSFNDYEPEYFVDHIYQPEYYGIYKKSIIPNTCKGAKFENI